MAVIAAKNEVIFNLQRHVASLEEQLKNPAPVNVKVEMPTVQVPSGMPSHRRTRASRPDEAAPEPIDWENVDENDNVALAKIAAQELGGPTTPYILSETVKRIKRNIHMAKLRKVQNLLKEGAARLGISPEATVAEKPDLEAERVPAHILNMIEEAERA